MEIPRHLFLPDFGQDGAKRAGYFSRRASTQASAKRRPSHAQAPGTNPWGDPNQCGCEESTRSAAERSVMCGDRGGSSSLICAAVQAPARSQAGVPACSRAGRCRREFRRGRGRGLRRCRRHRDGGRRRLRTAAYCASAPAGMMVVEPGGGGCGFPPSSVGRGVGDTPLAFMTSVAVGKAVCVGCNVAVARVCSR